jgi:hypothetical protein
MLVPFFVFERIKIEMMPTDENLLESLKSYWEHSIFTWKFQSVLINFLVSCKLQSSSTATYLQQITKL